MDFDIGTLVYIILTIVFLVIGAAGKKKKSSPVEYESEDNKQQQDNPLNTLEEKFNQLFSEDDSDSPKQKQEADYAATTEYEAEEEAAYDSRWKESEQPLDSPHDRLDKIPPEYNKVHKEKDERELYKLEEHIEEIARKTNVKMVTRRKKGNTYVSRTLRDFDPKRAYLFSEIFKPKYF